MSPERLPSQDSGGGGNGSINSGSSNSSGVNIIESATNMVLTNIPLESGGHVVIQHHSAQNQQHQQQTHRILNQQQQQSQQQLMTNGATTITGGIASMNRNNINNNSSNGNITATANNNCINFSASNGSSSSVGSNNNGGKSSTIITKPIVTATSPTKCIFFQQAGSNNGSSSQHQFITVTSDPHHQQHQSGQTFIATSPAAAAAVAAAGGNIVLVKTEPMEIINAEQITTANGTDEELTSLTWLHDKNLIKGIVACTNQPKSVTAAVTASGAAISPLRQSNGAVINGITNGSASPSTNDYLEDSCVSEDNLSSVNSSSDQGISMNSVEHSPASSISSSSSTLIQNSNGGGFSLQHQPQLYSQYSTSSNTANHHIQYTTSAAMKLNNNNSSSVVNKIRSHVLPITSSGSIIVSGTAAGISSTPSASNEHHLVGTTTTVHVGPSGTTTVVEYKQGSNFIVSPRSQIISQQVPSSPQRIHSSSSSASFNMPSHSTISQSSSSTVTGATNSSTNSTSSNTTSNNSSNTSSSSGSYLQHHHKKYIREQMNGLENNSQNSSNAGVNDSSNNSNANSNSSNSGNTNSQNLTNAQSSSPKKKYSIAVYSPSDQQQQSESSIQEVKEYIQATSTPIKNQQQQLHLPPSSSNYASSFTNGSEDHSKSSSYEGSYSSNATRPAQSAQKSINSPKQKHPTNVPYDPLVHTHNKPPYSFSSLIFMAIEDSPEKALPVKEIYAWIVQHFPYFKTAPTGWKNSVRHNLSLNKSFLKVEKAPNMGKGSLWRVEENQRANLIQALTRSPFYPCSIVEKLSPNKSPSVSQPSPIANDSPPSTPTKSTLDAKLFPKLSKMIKEMVNKGGGNESHATSNGYGTGNEQTQYENIEKLARDCGADSIEDVNAATAMLALKHGPKVFSESFNNGSPVITSSPSEDHTYSAGGTNGTGATNNGVITVNNGNSTNTVGNGVTLAGNTVVYTQNASDNNSNGTLSDAAYESSEESQHHHISTREIEEEEERRHREGVDALLTFASKVSSMSSSGASSPVKRPASTSIEEEHISYITENISSRLNNNNNVNGFNSSSASYIEDESSESYNGHNHQNGHEYRVSSSRGQEEHNRYNQNQQRSIQFHTQQGTNSYFNHVISPSPAKKLKSSKNIRSKIKRKTAGWIR